MIVEVQFEVPTLDWKGQPYMVPHQLSFLEWNRRITENLENPMGNDTFRGFQGDLPPSQTLPQLLAICLFGSLA